MRRIPGQPVPVPGAVATSYAYLASAVAVLGLGLIAQSMRHFLILALPPILILIGCLTLLARRLGWNWLYELALASSAAAAIYSQYAATREAGVALDAQLFNLLPVTLAGHFRSGWSTAGAVLIAGGGRAFVLLSAATSSFEVTFAILNSLILTIVFALTGFIIHRLSAAQRATEARLIREAQFDPLTQVLNRRGLERWVAANPGPCAVLMLDLDHFKQINDTRGHEAGDRLLADLAANLLTGVGERDAVARLGGEEFVVLLAGGSIEGACALTRQFATTIRERCGSTASYGVTRWDGVESLGSALRRADAALYAAKQAGRNQTQVDDGRGSQLNCAHPA